LSWGRYDVSNLGERLPLAPTHPRTHTHTYPCTPIPIHTDAYDSYYLHVPRSCFIDRESWFGELCGGAQKGGGVLKRTEYWWAGYKSETFFPPSSPSPSNSHSLSHPLPTTSMPFACLARLIDDVVARGETDPHNVPNCPSRSPRPKSRFSHDAITTNTGLILRPTMRYMLLLYHRYHHYDKEQREPNTIDKSETIGNKNKKHNDLIAFSARSTSSIITGQSSR